MSETPKNLQTTMHDDIRVCREAPISVSECVHCGCLSINAQSDECECGKELYPVRTIVQPGARIRGQLTNAEKEASRKDLHGASAIHMVRVRQSTSISMVLNLVPGRTYIVRVEFEEDDGEVTTVRDDLEHPWKKIRYGFKSVWETRCTTGGRSRIEAEIRHATQPCMLIVSESRAPEGEANELDAAFTPAVSIVGEDST